MKDCDIHNEGIGWGQALQVCVKIYLQKPNPLGRTINFLGEKLWILLTYKKLLRIYFKCKKITHGPQEYDRRDYKTNEQYGTWLMVDFRWQP